jgi:TP901 family phage tail tape measure protein
VAGGRIDIEVAPDLSGFPGKLQSGLKSSTGLASSLGKGLGLAIAAGTAVAAVGLKSVLEIGIQYESQLNTLQAVTQATGVQMAQVGNLAKQLGADMTLPATSAADAAAAMTELAKGGLSVEQAMTAAKGTLQLAAAAQIDAARAAEIQSDALNQFGLSADQAGHVADLLANAANSASGEITDMANSLKFVGPVARSVGENIDNVTTAIALLAVNGIRGEQAGTSLRGMIASLSAPSGPASKALETLGVKAFDATGKFVGLRSITEQLAKAKGRLSDAAFAEAAAVAFGNEGLTTATSLASSGAKAFDDMSVAVTRAGGAADVAAAKTKGLGGAWEGFKSQLETTGIEIFEAIDAPLEGLVRSSANFVQEFGGNVADGIEQAIVVAETFGPRVADAIKSRAQVVGTAVSDVFRPLANSSVGLLNSALNTGLGLWDDFTGVLRNATDAARPAATGIAAVADAAIDADGPVSAVASGVGLLGDAVGAASGLLVPLGKIVGVIAGAFASLPGPIQTAIVALGLLAAFRNPLSSLGQTVQDRVTAPFRNLSETIRLQQALLTGSTQIASQQVGKLGLAFSALEKNVPVIGRLADASRSVADSYRQASSAAGTWVTQQHALTAASGALTGTLRGAAPAFQGIISGAAGAAAAVGVGLKSAVSGLVSTLGGPWGIAIAAAGVGLSLLAKNQQEAAQKAAEHKQQLSELRSTLDQTTGAVTRQTREQQANKNASDGINDAAKRQKVALDDLLDAQTGNADALEKVNSQLRSGARSFVESNEAAIGLEKTLRKAGISFDDLTEVAVGNQDALSRVKGAIAEIQSTSVRQGLTGLLDDLQGASGDFSKLGGSIGSANDNLKTAIKNVLDARKALGDSSPFVAGLASSMGVLASSTSTAAEKAGALKRALDILSGGEIGLTAAQAEFNRTVQGSVDALGEGADRAKGWGDQIIGASGKLSVATKNGQDFQRAADGITGALLNVATATFDVSKNAGDTLPQSFEKVKRSVQESRDKLIDLAVNGYGVSRESAEKYADQLGLIPEIVATQVTTGGSAPAVTKEVAEVLKGLRGLPKDTPVQVTALTDEARRLLLDLGYRIETMPDGRVAVYADTSPGQSEVDRFIRNNNGRVIGIRVSVGGTEGVRIGGPNVASYDGNLIQAAAYASGGIHRMKPMKGGLATIVPPNTWRIVGDRLRDDEAYIPINQSRRSVSLLDETARRMGYALARRYANGGIAATTSATAVQPMLLDGMAITGRLRVDMDGYATLVDARISRALDAESREVRYRGGRP